MLNLNKTRILLTGGFGFLGSHVYAALIRAGAKPSAVFRPRSSQLDLRNPRSCSKAVFGKDLVIHLAASVGGIGYNQQHPGQLFYDNISMGVHLIEAARKALVKKFVQIGTVCAYPQHPSHIPFRESDLWSGYPESTNAPYGIAKLALLEMLQAYRREYSLNGIYLLPTNLYGPGDNFDPNSSHVIPALVRKFTEAVRKKERQVVVWGSGAASREFLYVADAARGIIQAVQKYDKPDPVNLGSGSEITIRQLASHIAKLAGYKGEIVWDASKPDGQVRRTLNTARAKKEFGFVSTTSFAAGLKATMVYFKKHLLRAS